jgi:hypothetical protein
MRENSAGLKKLVERNDHATGKHLNNLLKEMDIDIGVSHRFEDQTKALLQEDQELDIDEDDEKFFAFDKKDEEVISKLIDEVLNEK